MAVCLGTWVQAGKGNNGKGGGNDGGGKPTSTTYKALFFIPDYDVNGVPYDLLGDGYGCPGSIDACSAGSYYSEDSGATTAEFVGSGNPLLKVDGISRWATVNVSGCVPVDSNDTETIDALSEKGGVVDILGISPYGTVDGNGNGVDGFLGLQPGEEGLTLLGIGMESPSSDGRAWSLRFDPAFRSDLAPVKRHLDAVNWTVDTDFTGRKAVIVRPPKRGNGPKEVVAVCDPFELVYDVTCDPDGDGFCDPK